MILLRLFDFLLNDLQFLFDTLIVGVILWENLIHFLTVSMLLCWFDSFGIFSFNGLNTVVVIFQCCNHLTDWFDILYELVINSLIVLFCLLLVRILIIKILIRHGLCWDIKILNLLSRIPFWVRVVYRSFYSDVFNI